MLKKSRKRALPPAAMAIMLASGVAVAATVTMSSYQTALIPLEGGAAGFQATGSGGAYLGAFQLSQAALQDAGWKNADGSWTAQAQAAGVNSTADFLANDNAQIAADTAYNAKNVSYLGSTYTNDLGTTDPYSGAALTSGSLTYCAESLGAGGCKSYLATGVIPANDLANNPSWANGGWQNNLKLMSSTSTSDDGSVDVNTTTSGTGSSAVTTTTVAGVFCDPAIMNQVVESSRTMADSWTMLASRPETGYTMLGGQSVLEAAGLLTQGQPGYVGTGGLFGSTGGTFGQASCLDRLTNSGVNIIFGPPSLGDILGTLEQAACNMATQLFTQITAPLDQSVNQAFDMNGLVPGLSLGSLGASASISVGSSGTNVYSPDTGWYGTSTSSAATSYGSLFGGSSITSGGLY